jgi:subtilisin-like proprotein convertase family protein
LTVTEVGRIAALTLSLNIEHSYIGDLRVALTSPSGSQVLLHDRSGASNNDLVASYSSTDHQGINSLIGEPAAGDWTLHLADLAAADVGRLRHWRLALDLEPSARVVRGEDTPALRIPDNDPTGVSGSIRVNDPGNARALRVGVDITHSYIGDLRVELVAPSGRKALLHNRFGGSADNLIRSYESDSHAELAALAGEAAAGEWVLHIADLAGQDIGKFNRWELELTL